MHNIGGSGNSSASADTDNSGDSDNDSDSDNTGDSDMHNSHTRRDRYSGRHHRTADMDSHTVTDNTDPRRPGGDTGDRRVVGDPAARAHRVDSHPTTRVHRHTGAVAPDDDNRHVGHHRVHRLADDNGPGHTGRLFAGRCRAGPAPGRHADRPHTFGR